MRASLAKVPVKPLPHAAEVRSMIGVLKLLSFGDCGTSMRAPQAWGDVSSLGRSRLSDWRAAAPLL